MKKSIFVIVALSFGMIMSLVSCKSGANSEDSASADFSKYKSGMEEYESYVNKMKDACNDKACDDALKYYEEALKKEKMASIEAYNAVKNKADLNWLEQERTRKSDDLRNFLIDNCDCISDDERVEFIHKIYDDLDFDRAFDEASKRVYNK